MLCPSCWGGTLENAAAVIELNRIAKTSKILLIS